MGFVAFVKFALVCFDALAWPLFALGYPVHASIQAIEANSNSDTKKLVTYWVIFSLISLFEHAFMGMLQWLPFWPYMKLTIVCWMMIPQFDGAFYIYNHFVHPCLHIDVQTIVNWFKKQQGFLLKDNFLGEADKYVKAHGPEALEKLIATKSEGTEHSMMQKSIKPVQITEKREVAPVNSIPESEPSAAQAVNNMIALPEIDGAAGYHPPEIPSDKQVQKEWTCAMCHVITKSERDLNSHLQGRRHRDAFEELMKAKYQPSKGKVPHASVVAVQHSDVPRKEPQKQASSTGTQASQKKQQHHVAVAKNCVIPGNNASTSSEAVDPKTGTGRANLPNEEPKKPLPNNMAGNQVKPSGKERLQQVQKKHPQFRCTICNVNCTRSEDLNCHLWGKKHLARIQELNSLGEVSAWPARIEELNSFGWE